MKRPIPVLPTYITVLRDLSEHIEYMQEVRGGCILAELEEWVYLRTRLSGNQNHRCCWCGTPFSDQIGSSTYPTIEHVVPKSLGGERYDPDNLAVACSRCNQKRKTKPIEDFFGVVKENGWMHRNFDMPT